LNLADPQTLRAFLNRHGLSARKGLGQHFLQSPTVVQAILKQVAHCAGVVEIGPGPGVLTSPLSEAHPIIALEVDDDMIEALKESSPNADVRKADALQADLGSILRELSEPRAVVSNLPYYITAPLLTRIAEASSGFELAVLMMQREVADRVVAKPGDRHRGSLSVYLQARFDISKVANVPAGAFLPPPKVDSAVLKLVSLPNSDDSEAFFAFVRSGFQMPRKTLVNNLIAHSGLAKEHVEAALKELGLDERIRPQFLELSQWRSLAAKLI